MIYILACLALWVLVSLPIGILVGKMMHFGMEGD